MMIDGYEELAELICDPGYPGDVYARLKEKYGIDMETFISIVDSLMRFTPVIPRTTREHGVEYTRGFVDDGRHIVSQVVGPHKVDTMSNDLYRRLCDNELKSKIDSINKAYSDSAHDAKNHWVGGFAGHRS